MHRGWTKRWRKRWDKRYHRDHLLWIMMDYFIDFANHHDSEVFFPGCGVIPLKRGQHIFGTVQLAEFLGVDRNSVRRKLKILKTINFITIKTTNKYSIASIINYDTYQDDESTNNHQNNQQKTSKRPADDQQMTTPKNVKNVKKGNNPPNPPGGDVEKTWKTDFQIYLTQCRESFKSILSDPKWVFDQSRLNPGVDIRLTMEKAAVNYWSTEGAWKRKKKQKITDINWKLTWQNALTSRQNRVYKDAVEKECGSDNPIPKTYSQCQDYEERQKAELLRRSREKENGEQGIDRQALT